MWSRCSATTRAPQLRAAQDGGPPSDAELETICDQRVDLIVAKTDVNGDGRISREEFLSFFTEMVREAETHECSIVATARRRAHAVIVAAAGEPASEARATRVEQRRIETAKRHQRIAAVACYDMAATAAEFAFYAEQAACASAQSAEDAALRAPACRLCLTGVKFSRARKKFFARARVAAGRALPLKTRVTWFYRVNCPDAMDEVAPLIAEHCADGGGDESALFATLAAKFGARALVRSDNIAWLDPAYTQSVGASVMLWSGGRKAALRKGSATLTNCTYEWDARCIQSVDRRNESRTVVVVHGNESTKAVHGKVRTAQSQESALVFRQEECAAMWHDGVEYITQYMLSLSTLHAWQAVNAATAWGADTARCASRAALRAAAAAESAAAGQDPLARLQRTVLSAQRVIHGAPQRMTRGETLRGIGVLIDFLNHRFRFPVGGPSVWIVAAQRGVPILDAPEWQQGARRVTERDLRTGAEVSVDAVRIVPCAYMGASVNITFLRLDAASGGGWIMERSPVALATVLVRRKASDDRAARITRSALAIAVTDAAPCMVHIAAGESTPAEAQLAPAVSALIDIAAVVFNACAMRSGDRFERTADGELALVEARPQLRLTDAPVPDATPDAPRPVDSAIGDDTFALFAALLGDDDDESDEEHGVDAVEDISDANVAMRDGAGALSPLAGWSDAKCEALVQRAHVLVCGKKQYMVVLDREAAAVELWTYKRGIADQHATGAKKLRPKKGDANRIWDLAMIDDGTIAAGSGRVSVQCTQRKKGAFGNASRKRVTHVLTGFSDPSEALPWADGLILALGKDRRFTADLDEDVAEEMQDALAGGGGTGQGAGARRISDIFRTAVAGPGAAAAIASAMPVISPTVAPSAALNDVLAALIVLGTVDTHRAIDAFFDACNVDESRTGAYRCHSPRAQRFFSLALPRA